MASGQRVGYIRVSSVGQNPEGQLDGVEADTVFTDTVSGKSTDRPQLQAMLRFARAGDTIIVHSMDRLARNLEDLRRLVRELTGRGVCVQFMKEQLTFTAEDSPMATLLLSVLGAFAEFERALIRERQAEGIALARARGAYRGRKPSLSSDQAETARAAAGEPKASLARELGISRQTLCLPAVGRTSITVGRPGRGQDGVMTDVADPVPSSDLNVYQLRVVIAGISPLIWRRLLVPATTTIAQLHIVLQTVFGWSGEQVHRFVIHGREYGISSIGGPGFRDDARSVRLGGLGLRLSERFAYEYNLFAAWEVQPRVERMVQAEPGRTYPRCIGGRRAGPPEEWGGPWDFLERTQPHLVFDAIMHAAEIVRRLLEAAEDDDLASVGAHRDELPGLVPLLGLERFDRRACNEFLTAQATDATEVRT